MRNRSYHPLTLAISACALSAALFTGAAHYWAWEFMPKGNFFLGIYLLGLCLSVIMLIWAGKLVVQMWRGLTPDQRRELLVDMHAERGREARRRTPPPGSVG